MKHFVRRMFRQISGDRKGATAVEYGLIIGLLALAIIGSVAQVGSPVENHFEAAANGFPD